MQPAPQNSCGIFPDVKVSSDFGKRNKICAYFIKGFVLQLSYFFSIWVLCPKNNKMALLRDIFFL
jgi:hypothetical protein